MNLSAIEIEGFKSFPKKTRLTFTSGITAVIGPNGSGKSNVTEAIRWVLGEQSIKQLRGRESSDIIFHGTSKQQAARRAKVTLTFTNESGRFPGGTAEVAISRSLTRDGESHYMVNGDDVRLIDLQRLLAEAGIGARTFTVISQGMVDRYLTATPAARKELFDEATGVRSLQIQLQEAHRKLHKTQEHATEIETIIRELTPRVTVLRRQVKRYEQRRELEKSFQTRQRAWFSHAWHDISSRMEAADADLADLRRTIEAARSRRILLEQELTSQQRDGEVRAIHTQLAQAKAEYTQTQYAFKHYQNQHETLKNSLQEIQAAKKTAELELARARKTSQQYDWVSQAQALLEQCAQYFADLLGDDKPAIDITTLLKNIQLYLQQTKTTPAAKATKLMMDSVEKPLQQVARLSALEQERELSLKNLESIPQPTHAKVEQLEAKLATATHPVSESAGNSLESVRAEELEAERSLGAGQAAREQYGRELARLEEDILRECGSQALQEMTRTAPPKTEDIPTEASLRTLTAKLAAIGEPDPLVQKEYTEVMQRHTHLTEQLADIKKAAANIVDVMGSLHKQMQQQFAKQFTVIQKSFGNIFMQLFDGGAAQILHTEEGVEIAVTPPGKRSRHVSLLSGGERALTSLALLMAILEAQNPPFLVLDEVDAALDEANSHRFAQLLHKQCTHTQCLVVTHNREVMSVADVLYGVTMAQEGISSVYSVQLSDIEAAKTDSIPVQEMQI